MPDIRETLTSETGEVRRVLMSVHGKLRSEPGFEGLSDLTQIILGEILNNVVEHAYQFEGGHPIELAMTFHADRIHCRVEDEGLAMPDDRPPNGGMPELDATDRDSLPEGGFGWALVYEMTEDLVYKRVDGRNFLEFYIPIPSD